MDEVDEEDYNPFRALAHRMNIFGDGGDNDFLNHILQRDGLFFGRYDMGLGVNPLDHYRRGPQAAGGQLAGDDD